jgi:hypothetical protein
MAKKLRPGVVYDFRNPPLAGSGRNPADYHIRSCLVTDDKQRDWPAVRDGERRRMAIYNQCRAAAGGHGGVAGLA